MSKVWPLLFRNCQVFGNFVFPPNVHSEFSRFLCCQNLAFLPLAQHKVQNWRTFLFTGRIELFVLPKVRFWRLPPPEFCQCQRLQILFERILQQPGTRTFTCTTGWFGPVPVHENIPHVFPDSVLPKKLVRIENLVLNLDGVLPADGFQFADVCLCIWWIFFLQYSDFLIDPAEFFHTFIEKTSFCQSIKDRWNEQRLMVSASQFSRISGQKSHNSVLILYDQNPEHFSNDGTFLTFLQPKIMHPFLLFPKMYF